MPVVARTLRELRLDRGLSLRELSERAGLNKAIVSQIERGRIVATAREVARLAAALGVGELVVRTMVVHEEER